MKIQVNAKQVIGKYIDPTVWQNSTLRYAPPKDFPAYAEKMIGKPRIMRVFVTLDEFWDYQTDTYYPDFKIGVARCKLEKRHYPYDWRVVEPAPSGTSFEEYLMSHAACADELLLNVRRLEREVSDGVITYEKFEEVFEKAVEYCKGKAPNIRYIECCNEIELKSFGNLTPEEYIKIFLRAHRAVKRLNKKHNYEIPLLIGTNAIAMPLHRWSLMRDIMHALSKTEIGHDPMDFYAYHSYESITIKGMIGCGMLKEANMTPVQQLRMLCQWHNDLLKELSMPLKPIFLDELGRARATGISSDSLYNAAGVIVYLLAFGCVEQKDETAVYPFPWCTFHNPKLQISYTQFTLNQDGTYSMTPNGVAIKMLHDLHGDRLTCKVSESFARDPEYTAVAVIDGAEISVLSVNTSGETVPAELSIEGMSPGTYKMVGYLCDAQFNNSVERENCMSYEIEPTGKPLFKTAGEDGVLRHVFSLERNAFVRYRIVPASGEGNEK